MPKSPRTPRTYTNEQFVRVWQTTNSPAEAAAELKITSQQATSRAGHLRRKGVPLKKYYHRNADFEHLADLAKSLATPE